MYIQVDYTPEELISKLIGDYSYARAAFKIRYDTEITSALQEVHPQGGTGRYINEKPGTYRHGYVYIQIDSGYVRSDNPIATLVFEGDRIKAVNVIMRNPQADNFIRYLGKRLVVEDLG